MIALPLLPLWLIEYAGGVVVVIFTCLAWRYSRQLMTEDPENALWLFLNLLAMAFVLFAISHLFSHFIQANHSYPGVAKSVHSSFTESVNIIFILGL